MMGAEDLHNCVKGVFFFLVDRDPPSSSLSCMSPLPTLENKRSRRDHEGEGVGAIYTVDGRRQCVSF